MSNNNQQASREPTAATAAATQTQTQENLDEEVIPLRLTPAPRISWQEGTIDNEGLGRKSSKRCCIFHKQRKFGESSSESESESSEDDHSDSTSDGGPASGSKKHRKIARKKNSNGGVKQKAVPDHQRFHA